MSHTAHLASPVLGIGGTSGRIWKEQRKTSLEILRKLGMGKNFLADKIQEEVAHYIQAIEDLEGAPVDLFKLTQVSMSNNICSIIFGQRFEYDDSDFRGYLNAVDQIFKILTGRSRSNFRFGYCFDSPFSSKVAVSGHHLCDFAPHSLRNIKTVFTLLMQNDSVCVRACVRACV